MATIQSLVNAGNFSDFYVEASNNRQNSLGFELFPPAKQLGLKLSYLKGRNGAPVALRPSAFDADTPIRSRVKVQSFETEMPLFKDSYIIREIDRQQINTFLQGNQSNQANEVIRFVFDDARRLIEGADAANEIMRMQLLSTGAVHVTGEGADHTYDYGFDGATQKVTLTGVNKWDDPSSNPLADLLAWQKKVQLATGEKPRRAIMNSTTMAYLSTNNVIADALSDLVVFSDADITEFIRRRTGISIAVYDNVHEVDGVNTPFFPDNVVSLIPGGFLGNTHYGTTAEESDLMTGNTGADVSIVNTGVAVTAYHKIDPVVSVIKVSQISLPSFPSIEKLFIAVVA